MIQFFHKKYIQSCQYCKVMEGSQNRLNEITAVQVDLMLTPACKNLKVKIHSRLIGDAFVKCLESKQIGNIAALNLSSCQFSPTACQKMLKMDWTDLKQIRMIGCQIRNCDLLFLSSINWRSLYWLDISHSHIGCKGSKILSKGSFPMLNYFYLHNNKLGNEGILHLTKTSFPSLTVLSLRINNLTDASLQILKNSNYEKLESLQLGQNLLNSLKCLTLMNWDELNCLLLIDYGQECPRYAKQGLSLITSKYPMVHSIDADTYLCLQ